jgi:2,3-bisphosphoglycerate-dependent phosphoglycerate mutase
MQVYFIRHGQSSNNALWDSHSNSKDRSYDPELTEVGRQQARLLACALAACKSDAPVGLGSRDPQNLAGFGLTHIYSSLMLRALDTAHAVADALNLPVQAWLDLHEEGGLYLDDEISGGQVGQAGPGRTQLMTRFPRLELPAAVPETGWWNRPYEVEGERAGRAQRVIRDLFMRHAETNDHVALVGHGGFFNWLIAELLHLPAPGPYWFVLNNVAITRLDYHAQENETRLVYHNRVNHLPPDLIT